MPPGGLTLNCFGQTLFDNSGSEADSSASLAIATIYPRIHLLFAFQAGLGPAARLLADKIRTDVAQPIHVRPHVDEDEDAADG
jgi:hypothetical protein